MNAKKTDVTKIQCVAFNFCVAERTFSYLTTKTFREAEIIFDTIAKVYCFTVYEKRLISLWTNPKDFSFKFINLIQVYTLYQEKDEALKVYLMNCIITSRTITNSYKYNDKSNVP